MLLITFWNDVNSLNETQLQGGLIYANFGRRQDFDYLKSHGIDIRNQIILARYGAIFRGNIVNFYYHHINF